MKMTLTYIVSEHELSDLVTKEKLDKQMRGKIRPKSNEEYCLRRAEGRARPLIPIRTSGQEGGKGNTMNTDLA